MDVAGLPFLTDRLAVRAMTADDAPALAAYRSDPDVARFQEWDLPFTLDDARRFIAGMDGLSWPVLDDWYQVAIDLDGRMIGDVGVHRSSDGREATIGYTLAPDQQGHGYATEAVAAVIIHLFADGSASALFGTPRPSFVAKRCPTTSTCSRAVRDRPHRAEWWVTDLRFGRSFALHSPRRRLTHRRRSRTRRARGRAGIAASTIPPRAGSCRRPRS